MRSLEAVSKRQAREVFNVCAHLHILGLDLVSLGKEPLTTGSR